MSKVQSKVIERINDNASRLIDSYARSDALLRDAISDAMSWVPGLLSGVSFPRPQHLEHLCTQLLAIVIVSEPGYKQEQVQGRETGFYLHDKQGVVWEQS